VSDAFAGVMSRVVAAADRAGRDPSEVTVIAVSKGQTRAAIMEVYATGHRDFGENRAHELAEKAPELPDDIRWHFVGSLQRRKVKVVQPHVAVLHSLDRLALAETWLRTGERMPRCLVQVNVAHEPQKHGIPSADVAGVLDQLGELGVAPIGLMVIPPVPEVPEASRPWFDELRRLRDRLVGEHPALTELSMGMTDDFEVAVEAGATLIRVGRAIFGGASPASRTE
jgi:pyridoxal phosphate enzyme (YggS family)